MNLDTTRDAAGRPQAAISMRMIDDSGRLWVDALSFKQLRHGNATAMQESIFESLEEHGINQEDARRGWLGLVLMEQTSIWVQTKV